MSQPDCVVVTHETHRFLRAGLTSLSEQLHRQLKRRRRLLRGEEEGEKVHTCLPEAGCLLLLLLS